MSTAFLIAHQSRYDLRTFMRDPRARGFTVALPVILLLLFGYIFKHETFKAGNVAVSGEIYYLPRMIVLGLASCTLSNLVVVLVSKRETGALKRRRATPVRASVLIAGDIITSEVSAIAISILLGLIGWLVFKVHLDVAAVGFVALTVVVGTAGLCGVSYGLSTLIKSVDSAGPLVMLVMFALNAISGIYIPESLYPAWLRDAAQALPIRPLAVAMQAAVSPQSNGGRQFAWPELLIVLGWGVVGTLLALARFSWTPSRE
jgi:ABC-2 type transport system permease protein